MVDVCIPALTHSLRFVTPNRTRNTYDANTQQWHRAPGHFLARLEFGLSSQTIQDLLTTELGKAISTSRKKAIDDGATASDILALSPLELTRVILAT